MALRIILLHKIKRNYSSFSYIIYLFMLRLVMYLVGSPFLLHVFKALFMSFSNTEKIIIMPS